MTNTTLFKSCNVEIKIGDFLYSVGGDYLKTHIQVYEVLGKIGKTMVLIQEVKKNLVKNDLTGLTECIPQRGDYIGEPLRKRIQPGNMGVAISATNFAYFSKFC